VDIDFHSDSKPCIIPLEVLGMLFITVWLSPLQASQVELLHQHQVQELAPPEFAETEPMTEQHLAFLQQVIMVTCCSMVL